MNERIKELDKQAVEYALSVVDASGCYRGKEYLQVVKEKFAELIVKECIKFGHDDNGWKPDYKIKEHFGIK